MCLEPQRTSKNLKSFRVSHSLVVNRIREKMVCTVFFGFFLVNCSFILANQILDSISLIIFGYCQRVLTMSNGNALNFFCISWYQSIKNFQILNGIDSNGHPTIETYLVRRFNWAPGAIFLSFVYPQMFICKWSICRSRTATTSFDACWPWRLPERLSLESNVRA